MIRKDVKWDNAMFSHVLCTQKFSSGKHYWEVQVSGSWCVGVCIDTKRNHKVPLNPKNGFWVLQYDEQSGLCANTDPPTKLDTHTTLSKLGVCLDCVNNTLSFHDVDKKSHICLFQSMPSATFFPLIGPADE